MAGKPISEALSDKYLDAMTLAESEHARAELLAKRVGELAFDMASIQVHIIQPLADTPCDCEVPCMHSWARAYDQRGKA